VSRLALLVLLGLRAQFGVHLALELLDFTDGRQCALLKTFGDSCVRVAWETGLSVSRNMDNDSLPEIS